MALRRAVAAPRLVHDLRLWSGRVGRGLERRAAQTGDPAYMATTLARMEGPARAHDVDPHDYALLSDRVAMLQHRPQTYGSQFTCVDHRWTLYTLRDPEQVDRRRRALGLPDTEEQVEARIATYAPCFVPEHGGDHRR